jgi:XTP/dITP diphosphohydrolase
MITELFMATHNPGKIAELEEYLKPYNISIKSSNDIKYPETDETGTTFEENSILKVKDGYKVSGLPTIADDSGICVDALNGEPGVYSARYKGGYKTVLEKLTGNDNRKAHFTCVITYINENEDLHVFNGESHGTLATSPQGEGGFGYDPVFIPNGESKTYGEMNKEEKAKTSHRRKALTQFLDFLALEQ